MYVYVQLHVLFLPNTKEICIYVLDIRQENRTTFIKSNEKGKFSNRINCKAINAWIKIHPFKWIVSYKCYMEGITKI